MKIKQIYTSFVLYDILSYKTKKEVFAYGLKTINAITSKSA